MLIIEAFQNLCVWQREVVAGFGCGVAEVFEFWGRHIVVLSGFIVRKN